MKTVFSNKQLAHVWASQSQSQGRNSNNTMFFNETEIFSYGPHYLAAKIHTNGVVLVNNYNYSNTTAKQLRDIHRAVSHMKSFSVSNPRDPKSSIEDSANDVANQYVSMFTRIKYVYVDGFLDVVKTHNDLCEAFSVPKQKMNFPVDMIQDLKSYEKILVARELPKKLEREKRAEANRLFRLEKAKFELEAWKLGGPFTSDMYLIRPMALRIKGDTVETSGGAEVPLYHAKRLLTRVLNKTNVVGQKIGYFEINDLNETTIKIGCHEINIEHAKQVLE